MIKYACIFAFSLLFLFGRVSEVLGFVNMSFDGYFLVFNHQGILFWVAPLIDDLDIYAYVTNITCMHVDFLSLC